MKIGLLLSGSGLLGAGVIFGLSMVDHARVPAPLIASEPPVLEAAPIAITSAEVARPLQVAAVPSTPEPALGTESGVAAVSLEDLQIAVPEVPDPVLAAFGQGGLAAFSLEDVQIAVPEVKEPVLVALDQGAAAAPGPRLEDLVFGLPEPALVRASELDPLHQSPEPKDVEVRQLTEAHSVQASMSGVALTSSPPEPKPVEIAAGGGREEIGSLGPPMSDAGPDEDLALRVAGKSRDGDTADGPSSVKPVPGLTMQELSVHLSHAYLQIWSANASVAVSQVPQIYAPRINFYGRVVDRRSLMRDKERFVRRWPNRRYVHRPGTMQVDCDARASRCMVRSVIDWAAESTARQAASRGSARFEQGIDFSASSPVIFHESGSVIPTRSSSKRG